MVNFMEKVLYKERRRREFADRIAKASSPICRAGKMNN